MNSLSAATAFATINSTASILNKPRWTLPGSFNDPLAFIFFCRFFSFIKDNSLYSWSIKRPSFSLVYFHPYQSRFFFDLCVTIATKDVFLLQVSTFRTNIYVPLKWQSKPGNFVIWTAAKKETGQNKNVQIKMLNKRNSPTISKFIPLHNFSVMCCYVKCLLLRTASKFSI